MSNIITKFDMHWMSGDVTQISGTSFIDAFQKANFGADELENFNFWSFSKCPTDAAAYLKELKVKEDEIFEICLNEITYVDMFAINGIVPDAYEDQEELTGVKWSPPTIEEFLESWGWDNTCKVIFVNCKYVPKYATNFLKLLTKIEVPIVSNFDDNENVPKIFFNRPARYL